ncbi:DUF2914 domain-containing protein [Desulfococcaceae bacterium HSG9]|nr:DUF2914 domain-containing protein [Desulfococcaceae bacterium HSG9]
MLTKQSLILVLFILSLTLCFSLAIAKDNDTASAMPSSVLVNASTCEKIEMLAPVNQAAVFSVKKEQVFCLTTFNPVPQQTYVYHTWFRRDKLIKIKRLPLNPPRWTTFSSIQLRQADKGPWFIEINDRKGHLLKTLRFSLTE